MGDTSSAAAIAAFYTRSPTPRERQNHRIEDGTRLVYESFDENNIVDRRVNEGKILYFLLIGVNNARARLVRNFVTISALRRYENTGELPLMSDQNYMLTYMQRVANCPRAQELRWLYNMTEDTDSALHTEAESTADLLQRARESLRGFAEQ